MEDDALIDESFKHFLASPTHRKYDLLLLGYWNARVWRGKGAPLFMSDHKAFAAHPLTFAENCWGTAAYYVSLRGAPYLHQATKPVIYLADWPSDLTQIKAHVCFPKIVDMPWPIAATSLLERDRVLAQLEAKRLVQHDGRPKTWRRFLTLFYWSDWFKKRCSKIIP